MPRQLCGGRVWRIVKRRMAVFVSGVDVGAVLDQNRDDLCIVTQGRQMEFRIAEAELLKFRAALKEQLYRLCRGFVLDKNGPLEDCAYYAAEFRSAP